jgi:pilus assembly protein CpaB
MAIKSARLVVLSVALAAAGGAFMLSRSEPPPSTVQVIQSAPVIQTDKVLVAKRELPLGALIAPADIDWQDWPANDISPSMIRQSLTKGAVEDIAGSIARASFLAGEPMRRDKLVKGTNSGFMSAILPAGHRAVAINIDSQGSNTAGGFVLPNDKVDIIRTYRDEDASRSKGSDAIGTETILRNIRVLAIGQNVQEKNGQPVVVGTTATLELDADQAEQVILAQRTSISGNLSLALRSMMDGSTPETAQIKPSAQDDQGSMTVVRYGVAAQVSKK